jgi:hypothetical protein
VWLLALSSLARPEGLAWLAFGLWAAARRPATPRTRVAAFGAVAALLLYHGLRVHHFGALWPTPVLIKAQLGLRGAQQLAIDLLSAAAPLGCAALALRWPPRGVRFEMLAPLAISAAVLLAVNGDWMAYGRLLLPGVVATVLAWSVLAEPRPLGRGAIACGMALALLCGAIESRFLALPSLRLPTAAPLRSYAEGLQTPLPEQVAWLVAHAPAGALVQAADIGFISSVPRLRVLDSRGLASRAFATSQRTGDYGWLERLYASDARPDVIQVIRFVPESAGEPEPPEGLDPWLGRLDPLLARYYPHQSGVRSKARGFVGFTRFHRAELRDPTLAEQRARWRELCERFPSQPWLRERLRVIERRAARARAP